MENFLTLTGLLESTLNIIYITYIFLRKKKKNYLKLPITRYFQLAKSNILSYPYNDIHFFQVLMIIVL